MSGENIPEIVRCPPVLLIGFSRPSTLKEVFAKVREIKPSQIFLWLNKGRADCPDEVKRNDECRAIFDGIDWPCEIHRKYNEKYLECIDSFHGAFNWLFSQVDRAIILEDDCVPDLSFFRFCGELLEKYKNDTRVGMIAGHDEHFHLKEIDFHGDSYYFDRVASIWGWATWRRVWERHDPDMKYWPRFRTDFHLLKPVFPRNNLEQRIKHVDLLQAGLTGAWDGRWSIYFFKENLLCIHPTANLVSNIGVGISSWARRGVMKHCWHRRRKSPWGNRPVESMAFPLNHPVSFVPNYICEQLAFRDVGSYVPCYKRIWQGIKNFVKMLIGYK